ncbi:MAG: helix-hairpin-helix domain-containing protein [Tepidisphaeraceae bacterium]|jgi:competence protein ComEA
MAGAPDGIWTVSQRRGLIALMALVTAILALRLLNNRQTVADPEPPQGPAADELQDRIDPNVATAPQLAAIPGIGEKRAEAIVAFRGNYARLHPGKTAFSDARDLERVTGIGAATAEVIEPYLFFQPTAATRF